MISTVSPRVWFYLVCHEHVSKITQRELTAVKWATAVLKLPILVVIKDYKSAFNDFSSWLSTSLCCYKNHYGSSTEVLHADRYACQWRGPLYKLQFVDWWYQFPLIKFNHRSSKITIRRIDQIGMILYAYRMGRDHPKCVVLYFGAVEKMHCMEFKG